MKIGLVVSGGMAKGAYEVGALKAIGEYFRPEDFCAVSAASVGTLNAYAWCSGGFDRLEQLWRDFVPPGEKVFIKTAMTGDYLKEGIRNIASSPLLCGKFFFPLFNMSSRDVCYFDLSGKDEAARQTYLDASVAFFPICKPVEIDGRKYYDGALVDNIPVCTLMRRKLDYIICLYYDKNEWMFESDRFDSKIIKISFFDEKEIIKKSLWFELGSIDEMIDRGYRKAKAILDFVFSKGREDVAEVLGKIEELNALTRTRTVRMTGDVALDNLNRVCQLLTKRKFVD